MANDEHSRVFPVWKPDWVVTSELAKALVETSFPALAPVVVREFGIGWDNTVVLVNNSFVFRFPRRRIAVPLMETEVRLLPWLSKRVPLPIPNPCFVGVPTSDYPCVFAGYPLISGFHTGNTRECSSFAMKGPPWRYCGQNAESRQIVPQTVCCSRTLAARCMAGYDCLAMTNDIIEKLRKH